MWGKAFAGRKKQHGKSGYTLVMPAGSMKKRQGKIPGAMAMQRFKVPKSVIVIQYLLIGILKCKAIKCPDGDVVYAVFFLPPVWREV